MIPGLLEYWLKLACKSFIEMEIGIYFLKYIIFSYIYLSDWKGWVVRLAYFTSQFIRNMAIEWNST